METEKNLQSLNAYSREEPTSVHGLNAHSREEPASVQGLNAHSREEPTSVQGLNAHSWGWALVPLLPSLPNGVLEDLSSEVWESGPHVFEDGRR